jgi:CheY-like chemotaxis protein/signal recognition particle receptor subunit beta
MVVLDRAAKELTAKLVYYGPALSGKTANLRWIHEHVTFKAKGKLVSLPSEVDRTVLVDFLPVELGTAGGMRTRLHLYTVPGRVSYEAIRRTVLKGTDAVIFVCDSQESMLDADLASLQALRENIERNGLDPRMPMVLQYNKRDLPSAVSVATLNARLNSQGLPFFEAVATEGIGVSQTLREMTNLLIKSLAPYSQGTVVRVVQRAAPPAAHAAPAGPAIPVVKSPVPSAELLAPAVPAVAARDPEPPRQGLAPHQWVYLSEGKPRGPIEFDDLIDLVLTSVPEDTKVWRNGLAGWTLATLVPEIAEHIPPPLPDVVFLDEDFPDFNSLPEMLRVALIADEDASFRERLALPLVAQGFKIHEARDGAEAWRMALERRPWLILADLGLAEVDGFEFCRRVRANSLLRHTPLVFISGSDRYKDRYRVLQLGADDFLSKTTPVRELLIRIQLLMTRYSDLESGRKAGPGEGGKVGALQGRIEVFGAPGILQILSQGRLSGILTARTLAEGGDAAVLGFRDGAIVSAACEERSGPEAVYAFLAWERGQFSFIPGEPGPGEPIARSVEALLLEGSRLLDESRRGPDEPGRPT